jgi:ribonuclease HI
MYYYAVNQGKTTGVYSSWGECKEQITGYTKAVYRKFQDKQEAEYFVEHGTEMELKKPVYTKKTIFTDGATSNNHTLNVPRKSGIGVYFSDGCSISAPFDILPLTNQRAELYAIIMAIKEAIAKKWKRIRIYTDSMYSINCITKWCKKWKLNNWKKLDGDEIKNKEFIIELFELYNSHNIKFNHVKSHQNKPDYDSKEYPLWYGNKIADKLAVSGCG